jgi:hypothetical protein
MPSNREIREPCEKSQDMIGGYVFLNHEWPQNPHHPRTTTVNLSRNAVFEDRQSPHLAVPVIF